MGLYEKLFGLGPKSAEDYYNQGTEYADKGQYDQAISEFTKAIEIDPMYAPAYHNRGFTYADQHQYDKAITDLTKAIEINPKNAAAYYGLGQAYCKKGQYDQAISEFTKAIEINPKDAEAYNNRGCAYDYKGQYDQAIADFTKAIEINPRYGKAYYNRGDTYKKKIEYEKAREDVYMAQSLGYKVPPELLKALSEASEIGLKLSIRLKELIESIPDTLSSIENHEVLNLEDIDKKKLIIELTILTYVGQRLALQLMKKKGCKRNATRREEICNALDQYASEFLESSPEFDDLLEQRAEQYFQLLQSHYEEIHNGNWEMFFTALKFKFDQFCRGGGDEKKRIFIGDIRATAPLYMIAISYWEGGYKETAKYI
ncbi:MAG: tetratricopeptide repeat protein [Planctomycetes bacterium]|nr:tetratricopeptide repeat protein [Planctomycetota bacterium]